MGKEENFKGAGVKFSSEYQPKKSGRKKNRLKHLQNKFDLSGDDVNAVIETLLSMTKEELDAVVKNPKSTMIEINFAMALATGSKKGDLTAIEMLLNRKIGKPKETMQIDGNVKAPVRIIVEGIDSERPGSEKADSDIQEQ